MDAWLADHHIKVTPKNMSLGGDETRKILVAVQNIHLLEGDEAELTFKSGDYEKNYTIKLNKTNTPETKFIRRGGWRSG
ncbi:MAG: hypothetical protein GF334_10450 [Candidatus Altiarchaeales archaeon]|nr:hypothetical protein [Candidatus Altiarchaeales archaeon]